MTDDAAVWLGQVQLVGVAADGIDAGVVTPDHPRPGTELGPDAAFVPAGVDEDGNEIYRPNPVNQVMFSQTLELSIRSCAEEDLWVGVSLVDKTSLRTVGAHIACLAPGDTEPVSIHVDGGMAAQLILMVGPRAPKVH